MALTGPLEKAQVTGMSPIHAHTTLPRSIRRYTFGRCVDDVQGRVGFPTKLEYMVGRLKMIKNMYLYTYKPAHVVKMTHSHRKQKTKKNDHRREKDKNFNVLLVLQPQSHQTHIFRSESK